MKKPVTVRFIRFENKTEKVTIEDAIELIKKDSSHSKYTNERLQEALEKGVIIQLDNTTLQMRGVGYDSGPKPKEQEEE